MIASSEYCYGKKGHCKAEGSLLARPSVASGDLDSGTETHIEQIAVRWTKAVSDAFTSVFNSNCNDKSFIAIHINYLTDIIGTTKDGLATRYRRVSHHPDR